MPICHKCDLRFPLRVHIGGKLRMLNSRKYCLTCSPFGKHNTRKPLTAGERKCKYCDRQIQTKLICNSCATNRRRFALKLKTVAYKGGGCIRCGYKRCTAALDFHHRDPKGKIFNISGSHCRAWKVIVQELDKCDLVCRNCHAEIESLATGRPEPQAVL